MTATGIYVKLEDPYIGIQTWGSADNPSHTGIAAAVECCPCGCIAFEDKFTRPDSTDLGPNWYEETGEWGIQDFNLVERYNSVSSSGPVLSLTATLSGQTAGSASMSIGFLGIADGRGRWEISASPTISFTTSTNLRSSSGTSLPLITMAFTAVADGHGKGAMDASPTLGMSMVAGIRGQVSSVSASPSVEFSTTAAIQGRGSMQASPSLAFQVSAQGRGRQGGILEFYLVFQPTAGISALGSMEASPTLGFGMTAQVQGLGRMESEPSITFVMTAEVHGWGHVGIQSSIGFAMTADIAGLAKLQAYPSITFSAVALTEECVEFSDEWSSGFDTDDWYSHNGDWGESGGNLVEQEPVLTALSGASMSISFAMSSEASPELHVTPWLFPGTTGTGYGSGDGEWDYTTRVKADDGSYASARQRSQIPPIQTEGLKAYNFAFDTYINTAQSYAVVGIEFRVQQKASTADHLKEYEVVIADYNYTPAVAISENKARDDYVPASDETIEHGGTYDIWTLTIGGTVQTNGNKIVNDRDVGFGLSFKDYDNDVRATAYVDYVQARVWYYGEEL